MRVLVSDTCVISNLRNGGLLDYAFRTQFEFAVPDLLAEQELQADELAELIGLGLQVLEMPPASVRSAQTYRAARRKLSLIDCFALVLAQTNDWCLLTDDGLLRKTAEEANVLMHGSLWLVEQMAVHQVCSVETLCSGVKMMASHPTARLPRGAVEGVVSKLQAGKFGI